MDLPVPHDVRNSIELIIHGLPILAAQDLPDTEDSCPICLTSFSSIFLDTDPEAGVTKLTTCNHIFCRKDLTQWIQSLHGNCPTCRHTFLDIKTPSESDDESSDGGEYIPNERDDDFDDFDDDGFLDTDGFSDAADYVSEGMDLDPDVDWEGDTHDTDADMEDTEEEMDGDVSEWGLTDGESFNMLEYTNSADLASEGGDVGMVSQMGISVSVHSDDEGNEHIQVVDKTRQE